MPRAPCTRSPPRASTSRCAMFVPWPTSCTARRSDGSRRGVDRPRSVARRASRARRPDDGAGRRAGACRVLAFGCGVMTRPAFDAAIVGAGAVGAALALALTQRGRRVALIDGRPGPAEAPGSDYGEFVVSLNLASVALLTRLGAWPAIRAHRVSPYGAMSLWDAGGSGTTFFDSAAIGEPVLGYFVEAALAESALHTAARDNGVAVYWGETVEALTVDDTAATLTCAQGRQVSAGVAIGADGARSPLRALAGIGVDRYDYRPPTTRSGASPAPRGAGASPSCAAMPAPMSKTGWLWSAMRRIPSIRRPARA
ncbi:MAG: hypothetical protein BRD57_03580 [Proteobacteria bacterium SW_6_67_9]|nr:MAG: hypothetical protein BRD57_03580 [Proteobacteria bacterium SW_6_67_9]